MTRPKGRHVKLPSSKVRRHEPKSIKLLGFDPRVHQLKTFIQQHYILSSGDLTRVLKAFGQGKRGWAMDYLAKRRKPDMNET